VPPKKPTLTLRQPPPVNVIADLEAADRFVRGESAEPAPGSGPNNSATAAVLRIADPPPVEEIEPTPQKAEPAPLMKLVEVSPADTVPSFRRADKSISVRKRDGAVVRRTTIYFELEVAKQLAAFCVGEQRDVSDVVSEAVKALLAKA